MSYKLKVCVIDDEKDVRQELVDALNESNEITVIGEAESVKQAFNLIHEKKPDAVFLDIKLLEGDAFQLINLLKRNEVPVPPIILNTGFNNFEYAKKTFNKYKDCVVRILEKPFWEDWEKKQDEIVDAIIAHHSTRKSHKETSDRLIIKSDYQTWFVDVEKLRYVEVTEELKGQGKIKLVTDQKEFVIKRSMTLFLEQLPDYFIRISRFCIVNTRLISHYDHSDHTLFLDNSESYFGVGNAYYQNLEKWMKA